MFDAVLRWRLVSFSSGKQEAPEPMESQKEDYFRDSWNRGAK